MVNKITTAITPTEEVAKINEIIDDLGKTASFNLFDWKWTDHELNDQSWLNANTFSWQDGTVYSDAYNHLVDDIDGITSTTETIGSYTVTVYVASDGHKIVLANQETNVSNIYNESGVAWYYVLDTVNQRFKLPRSTHGEIVEKYHSGTNWYRVWSDGWCEQGGSVVTTSTNPCPVTLLQQYATTDYTVWTSHIDSAGQQNYYRCIKEKTTAGFSFWTWQTSGITTFWVACGYTNKPTQNSQYKYLYFYVGQFSQSATEQTAGLNASLFNGKVDLDGSNATFPHITQTYINGTDWYRIWSDGWCEQGGTNTYDGNQLVTLLVPFKDTNYFVLATGSSRDNSNPNYSSAVGTRTTTQFNLSFSNSTTGNSYNTWRAYGYIS